MREEGGGENAAEERGRIGLWRKREREKEKGGRK